MTRDEIATRLNGYAWVADHTKATLFDTAKWLLAQADALAATLGATHNALVEHGRGHGPLPDKVRQQLAQNMRMLAAYRGTDGP